jgi:hypothetical protein
MVKTEHPFAPCLKGTSLKPVIACFDCPARLSGEKCEELRIASGYKYKSRKGQSKLT